MAHAIHKFRNAIICEDIRDEVGNKKSLIGVMSGDIVIASLPAQIQIAFYLDYIPDAEDGDNLSVDFRLALDDETIGAGKMEASDYSKERPVTFIIPKGIVKFENETTLRVFLKVNDGDETELIARRIRIMGEAIS